MARSPGQIINVPLAGTLDEKTNPHLVEGKNFAKVQNVRQLKSGEFTTRDYFNPKTRSILGGGSISINTLDGPVTTLDDVLTVRASQKLYSYIESQDVWAEKDGFTQFDINSQKYAGNILLKNLGNHEISTFVDEDMDLVLVAAYKGGVNSLFFEGVLTITSFSYSSGAVLDSHEYVSSSLYGSCAKFFKFDSTKVGIVIEEYNAVFAAPQWFYSSVSSSGIFTVAGGLGTLLKLSSSALRFSFEAEAIDSSAFILASPDSNTYESYTDAGVSIATVGSGGTTKTHFAVGKGSNGYVTFFEYRSSTGNYGIYQFTNRNLTGTSGITLTGPSYTHTIDSLGMCMTSDTTATVWISVRDDTVASISPPWYNGTASLKIRNQIEVGKVSVTPTTGSFTTSPSAISRLIALDAYPWYDTLTSKSYAVASYQDCRSLIGPQSVRVLLDEDGVVCATLDQGECFHSHLSFLPRTMLVDNTAWIPVTKTLQILETRISATTPIRYWSGTGHIYKFTPITSTPNRIHDPGVEMGEVSVLSGAYPRTFDNHREYPINTEIWPSLAQFSKTTAASSLSAGTYGVAVTYEFYDERGVKRVSAAAFSDPITIAGATESLTVVVPTIGFGFFKDSNYPYYISVYRTVANGSIYYRDTTLSVHSPGVAVPTTKTFTLDVADVDIEDEEVLYQVVELPNSQPPASLTICESEDKVFLVPATNRNIIWESKPTSYGRALEFSQSLTINFPGKGKIVGMTIDNGRKVVFKEDSIWYFTGFGRDATGQGQFSEIRHLTDKIGAISTGSIKSTSMGVVFQSQRGIFLLTSDLQLQYIGAPIEDTLGDSVVAAVLENTKRQELLFCLEGVADANTYLVWDYFHNSWYVHNTTTIGIRFYEFFLYKNEVYSLGQQVYKETSGTSSEEPVFITLETGWIKTGAIQEEGRALEIGILGEITNNPEMYVYIYTDYSTASSQTAEIPSGALGNPFFFRMKLENPSCAAVKVAIRTFDLEAVKLTDLAVMLYPEGGVRRLADIKQG